MYIIYVWDTHEGRGWCTTSAVVNLTVVSSFLTQLNSLDDNRMMMCQDAV